MTKTTRKEIIEEFDDNGKLIQRTTTEETIEEMPDKPYYDFSPYWGVDRSNITYCGTSGRDVRTGQWADTETNVTTTNRSVDTDQTTIEDFFRGK